MVQVTNEATNVPHVFALGDCTVVDFMFANAHWANPELTPIAIKVRQRNTFKKFHSGERDSDLVQVMS